MSAAAHTKGGRGCLALSRKGFSRFVCSLLGGLNGEDSAIRHLQLRARHAVCYIPLVRVAPLQNETAPKGVSLKFPNAVVLNAVADRNSRGGKP